MLARHPLSCRRKTRPLKSPHQQKQQNPLNSLKLWYNPLVWKQKQNEILCLKSSFATETKSVKFLWANASGGFLIPLSGIEEGVKSPDKWANKNSSTFTRKELLVLFAGKKYKKIYSHILHENRYSSYEISLNHKNQKITEIRINSLSTKKILHLWSLAMLKHQIIWSSECGSNWFS